MSRTVSNLLLALFGLLILLLLLTAFLIWRDGRAGRSPQPAVAAATTSPETAPATVPAASPTSDATPTELPLPVITVFPTSTPRPTATPSPTSPPTETPEPTETPTAPPPTAPPAVVRPTNTAVPPTAVPPTPVPQSNGLTGSHFALQPRAVIAVGGPIWFEFAISNANNVAVPYGALGVMPRKNGVDRPEWYQHSYGGNNDAIPPNGLSHEDRIILPESGSYSLRLVICFEPYNTCRAGGGTWITMSQEIPVSLP